jgi:hypothetical protein
MTFLENNSSEECSKGTTAQTKKNDEKNTEN